MNDYVKVHTSLCPHQVRHLINILT